MSVALPYLPRRYHCARLALFVLALLGFLSFTAVDTATVQCRNEPNRLLLEGGGSILLEGGGRLLMERSYSPKECKVVWGRGVSLAVSEEAVMILRKLGMPLVYL